MRDYGTDYSVPYFKKQDTKDFKVHGAARSFYLTLSITRSGIPKESLPEAATWGKYSPACVCSIPTPLEPCH